MKLLNQCKPFIFCISAMILIAFHQPAAALILDDSTVNQSKVEESVTFATKVNINQVTSQQLVASLQGIGKKKAQAIIDYRQQHGDFTEHEQLLQVKGIGKKLLEKNRELIEFGSAK